MGSKFRWILIVSVILVLTAAGVLAAELGGASRTAIGSAEAGQRVLLQYPGTLLEVVRQGERYAVQVKLEHGVYETMVDAYSGDIVALQRLSMLTASNAEDAQLESPSGQSAVAAPDSGLSNLGAGERPTEEGRGTSGAFTEAEGAHAAADVTGQEAAAVPNGAAGRGGGESAAASAAPDGSPAGESRPFIGSTAAGKIALAHIAVDIPEAELEEVKLYEKGKQFPYYLAEIDGEDGPDAVVQVHAISGAVLSVTWEDDDDNDDDNDDDDDDE